jgi:hypothetical protein
MARREGACTRRTRRPRNVASQDGSVATTIELSIQGHQGPSNQIVDRSSTRAAAVALGAPVPPWIALELRSIARDLLGLLDQSHDRRRRVGVRFHRHAPGPECFAAGIDRESHRFGHQDRIARGRDASVHQHCRGP